MPKMIAAALLAVVLPVFVGAGAAVAADAAIPVKAVMDATVANWAGGDSEWQDIFDDSKLDELYSKDFVAKYQAAARFPAVDEDGISPFDYDVIVGGQDACPLEDLTITPQAAAGKTTEVLATFKKSTCMGTDAEYQAVTTVRFEVIQEDNRPVIDDIMTVDDQGKTNSLKASMQDIVTQQQQPSAQPQQSQQPQQ
jgi:opacity protein-like surface antigen